MRDEHLLILISFVLPILFMRDWLLLRMGPTATAVARLREYGLVLLASVIFFSGVTFSVGTERLLETVLVALGCSIGLTALLRGLGRLYLDQEHRSTPVRVADSGRPQPCPYRRHRGSRSHSFPAGVASCTGARHSRASLRLD